MGEEYRFDRVYTSYDNNTCRLAEVHRESKNYNVWSDGTRSFLGYCKPFGIDQSHIGGFPVEVAIDHVGWKAKINVAGFASEISENSILQIA